MDPTEYSPRSVVEALGEEWAPLPGNDWFQVVYRPSFDPELVATVWSIGAETRLRARTAQCNLWYLHQRAHDSRSIAPAEPLPEPRLTVTEFVVAVDEAERLWRAMSIVEAAGPTEQGLGTDGIPITVRWRSDDSVVERELWSPGSHVPERLVIDSVLALLEANGDGAVALVATRAARYLS